MNALRRVLGLALIAYLGLCAIMFFTQRSMQYRPDPSPMNPASVGLPMAKQSLIETSDGERIVTWWVAPQNAGGPIFLYLHGNGGNLHDRVARFERLTANGAGLLAVSYRGYGGSSGSPTETGLHIDARTAYDTLVSKYSISPRRIVVFGESLGTTIATMLAAEVPIAALMLDSSFDSALDIASRAYPWLPVRGLLLDQFRADRAAAKVKAPVQQVHCRDDPVTPLASAQLLRARFANPLPMQIVESRCHVPPIDRFVDALERVVDAAGIGQGSVGRTRSVP